MNSIYPAMNIVTFNLLIVVDETDNLTTVRRVRRKTGNINNTTFELCSY